eukprot:Seg1804.3 transcript_id=Seg1804.3/GoldUCD/mRNA.D3Y31 product="hypothetical protein" protein_id=Seg1804.3/GoldUCD/D3Y31
MSKTCEFADETFEIEEQIIIGGRSSRIRKRALRDPEYSLKDMLIDGRRGESSSYQAKDTESKEETAETTHRFTAKQSDRAQCGNCGRKVPHKGPCLAKGKTCRNCNKPDHFAAVCRSSKPFSKPRQPQKANNSTAIRPLQHESDTSEDEYMYTVCHRKPNPSKESPKVNVMVGEHQFAMIVDTGSTINVIDKNTFDNMKGIKLQPTKVKAYPYNNTQPVQFIGKFEALVKTKSRYAVATFFVLKQEDSGCLLSAATAQEMGIISLKLNKITTETPEKTAQAQIKSNDPEINDILQDYQEVFTGVGKWKGCPVKLNIDEILKAIPHAQPQRRVPFHIRKKSKSRCEGAGARRHH